MTMLVSHFSNDTASLLTSLNNLANPHCLALTGFNAPSVATDLKQACVTWEHTYTFVPP